MKETLLIKNFTKQKVSQKYLNKIAEKTLEIMKFKKPAEISLVIVGDQRIKTLNKKYRGKNKITDVLSFGMLENKSDAARTAETSLCSLLAKEGKSPAEAGKKNKKIKFISPKEKAFLGEIFICYPQAARQAKGRSIKKEITALLIHSILHLLGYNHHKKSETAKMKQKEKAVYSFCLKEN